MSLLVNVDGNYNFGVQKEKDYVLKKVGMERSLGYILNGVKGYLA